MSARPSFREAPTVRDLLNRSTWEELDRIAGRYGVQFAGRRRAMAVERLALLLERPDQLRAAYKILPEPTRALLGLLLLLGSSDDERSLALARDRLVAARPELEPLLARVHIPNEVQTLVSLGLCFRDRRRLLVPVEALNALPCAISPSMPAREPEAPIHEYAALRYALESLIAAIEHSRPVAITPYRISSERPAAYQPLLLPHEAASELGHQSKLPPGDLTLLLSLLQAIGAIGPGRGRWQVLPEWSALASQAPRSLLAALLDAWQRPRVVSDLSGTREFVWICAPEVDGATVVAQHEATIRVIVWRWLLWCEPQPFDIELFARTLAALHAPLFQFGEDSPIWIGRIGAGRNLPIDESTLPTVVLALIRQSLHQLARLGLVLVDGVSCTLTPTARWLHSGQVPSLELPALFSDNGSTLLVNPLAVDPELIRLLGTAGQMLSPQGRHSRYLLAADGMVRLLKAGVPIAAFEEVLERSGAQVTAAFRSQLALWAERAGRLRLHYPLTMILTAEDTPIAQILAAAGVAGAAEVLGPGCALIDPDYLDLAVEQLRTRGFWPLVVGGAATSEMI
jgi:hypothetical protein